MWRLGRYRVDDQPLAAGATAEVFAARKGRAGPRVAIKLLPLKAYRERAEDEADVAAIDHPRLLPIHERIVDERRGVVGLVMDLAGEGDLRTALRSGDEPTPTEMLQITDDVLAALEALHAVGVVHRDIKPENVMLERVEGELRARLGDLGIARAVDRTRSTGSVLGTDRYIAPEVHDGAAPSAAADLWAVGFVLYEGLFGAPPHAGAATTYQAIGRLRAEGADRPPNVPDAVWDVVARLLAPAPADRPASASEARTVVASASTAAAAASLDRPTTVVARRRSAGYRRGTAIIQPVRRRAWRRGLVAVASAAAVASGLVWGPTDLLSEAKPPQGAALAVTPLSVEADEVIPTQYQWRLRDGVLTGRLDVTNASTEPTLATTLPELFPREAARNGRLRLVDFDGVQERQGDGSVLVRFAVPPLAPKAHHVVAFRLALGAGTGADRTRLAGLLRSREVAINRQAFSLSDAPTLEKLSVEVGAATLEVGDTTPLTIAGTTRDGDPASADLLNGVRFEVVSGAGVVRVDGSMVRAMGPGTAVVRVIVGVIHADTAVQVRQPPPTATVRKPRPTIRPTTPPTSKPTTTEETAPASVDEELRVE